MTHSVKINAVPEMLRTLADAIESGEFFAPQKRPADVIPMPADGSDPRPGPGEHLFLYRERTGTTVIVIDRELMTICRPLKVVGYQVAPYPAEIPHWAEKD